MTSEVEHLSERKRGSAAVAGNASALAAPWEQRILQLHGKRYSLRLEREFWAALENIAAGRKLRLNRLVAEIAARRRGDGNLSSTLRVFCLRESERVAAARAVAIDGASITALVESAPAPGMLLDSEQVVLAANDAFLHWSGAKRTILLRQRLADHFRLQAGGSFDHLWSEPMREEHTHLVAIAPGRALGADATLVPVSSARGRRLCVLWLRG